MYVEYLKGQSSLGLRRQTTLHTEIFASKKFRYLAFTKLISYFYLASKSQWGKLAADIFATFEH